MLSIAGLAKLRRYVTDLPRHLMRDLSRAFKEGGRKCDRVASNCPSIAVIPCRGVKCERLWACDPPIQECHYPTLYAWLPEAKDASFDPQRLSTPPKITFSRPRTCCQLRSSVTYSACNRLVVKHGLLTHQIQMRQSSLLVTIPALTSKAAVLLPPGPILSDYNTLTHVPHLL